MTQIAGAGYLYTPDAQGAGTLEPLGLQFRLEPDTAISSAKAARTEDGRTLVPWPLDPIQSINFVLANHWLSGIRTLLANAIMSAKPEFVPDGDGAEETQELEDAKAWLARPDVGLDGVSKVSLNMLLKGMAQTYFNTGNIFCEIVPTQANDMPGRIARLLPQYVRYEYKDEMFQLYQVDPYREAVHFKPFGTKQPGDEHHEYIHERDPNDYSSYYGIPPWIAARDAAEVDNSHRRFLKGFFKNHSTPRYLISVRVDPAWVEAGQPPPDQTQLNKLHQAIKNFMSANQGDMSGRNLILNLAGGIIVEAQPLDNKVEDPTFSAAIQSSRDAILATLNVSALNLGFGENSNRSTSDNQSENFRKEVLEPFAAPAISIINKVLRTAAPSGLGLEGWRFTLNFERVWETLARFEALIAASGAPILTRDEARGVVGSASVGADRLLMPVNMLEDFGGEDE